MSKFYNTLFRVIPVLYVLLPDLLVRLRGRETTIGCMEWPLPRTPSWVSWHSLSQDSIALSILAAGVADLSLCNKPTPVNSTSERQERLLYDSNNAYSMYWHNITHTEWYYVHVHVHVYCCQKFKNYEIKFSYSSDTFFIYTK